MNSIEWRLHEGISLTKGTSKCPKCENGIKWYDNIPLVSFFVLKRKCRSCDVKISWQYPLVELWMALAFVFVLFFHSTNSLLLAQIITDCFIVWILTFIFIYDLKHMEVSDIITLGGTGVLFIIFLLSGFSFTNMALGAIIGGGFFFIQFILSKGRWVGGGDIRIGVLMGVILGWKLLLLALWIAYIAGAFAGIILLLSKKKKMKSEVPFGVFLTLATFVVMFLGQRILEWYMGFVSL